MGDVIQGLNIEKMGASYGDLIAVWDLKIREIHK